MLATSRALNTVPFRIGSVLGPSRKYLTAWSRTLVNPLKTKRNLLYIYIYKDGAYRAVNTFNLGYKKRMSC
jgi:hypothetical protein